MRMKNIAMKIMVVAVMVSLAGWVISGSAWAITSIAGSEHDFSDATSFGDGEICKACHTPHKADTTVTVAPLWNHEVTGSTFTLYTSGTLNASMGQPDGVSKLCLSCHDGTTALDSFGGATGSVMMTGDAKLGTDLANDHPISFTYDAALVTADGGLNATTANSGLGGTIGDDMLKSGKVQCSSCHDAHDNTNAPFLVKANTASALCLTCHNK